MGFAFFNNNIKIRRIFFYILIITFFAAVFTGCAKEPEAQTGDYFYSFEDALGNQVKLKEQPSRVISLVGSYAEIWVLAGGEPVGVTNDVITERNMELPEGTKIIGTIKDPNLEEMLTLSPDFVLLSPNIDSHVKLAQTLKKSGIAHAFFDVEHFEDYLNMLKICTDITGNKELYDKNGVQVQKNIQDILSKIDTSAEDKPSILLIRAFSSGAKAKSDDNMACRILNDLGTENIASRHSSLLEDLSMEVILQEDPDFIFVITMGDSEKAIEGLKQGIEKNPVWSGLTAVKDGRYIVLPKDLFHYKPNARWGESYEYLAKILYPDKFR